MKLSNELTPEQFCDLQEAVGFGRPKAVQIEKALRNCLYFVSAEVDGEVVGMGRIVGDGAKIVYIQDVFIKPEFQGKGIGKAIMADLMNYIKENAVVDTTITIGLMSAREKEGFYKKLGFRERPNEKEGAGMVMQMKIISE